MKRSLLKMLRVSWKAVKIASLIAVVLIIVAIAGLLALTQTDSGRALLLSEVIHALNTHVLDATVTAERLEGPLFKRLSLRGLELHSLEGRELATVDRVDAKYRLLPLLRGEMHLEEVQIRGLSVDGRIDEDGVLDLATVVPLTDEPSEPMALSIFLEHLVVEADRLVLRDGRNRDARLVEATDLSLILNAELTPDGIALSLPNLEASVWLGIAPNMPPLRAGLRHTHGTIDDERLHLTIEQTFAGDTFLEGLNVEMLFAETEIFSNLEVDVPLLVLDPETVNALYEEVGLLTPVTIQASFSGPPEALTLAASVESEEENGDIEAQLVFDLLDPFDPGWSGRLAVRRFRPHLWMDLDELDADLSFSVLLEGSGIDPANILARAEVDIGPSRVLGHPIYNGWLNAGWQRDTLRLEELRIETAGALALLGASASLDGSFELNGDVKFHDLAELPLDAFGLDELAGRLDLSLNFEGQIPIDELSRWQELAASDQLALIQAAGAAVSGELNLELQSLGLDDISVEYIVLKVESERSETPRIHVSGDLTAVEAMGETLDSADFTLSWLDNEVIAGVNAARGSVVLSAPELGRFHIDMSSVEGTLGGLTLSEADLELLALRDGAAISVGLGDGLQPERISIEDLTLDVVGAEFEASGGWTSAGELHGEFRLPQLLLQDVAELSKTLLPSLELPDISGVVAMSGSLSGPANLPIFDGAFSLEAFRMTGFDPPVTVRAKVSQDASGIWLQAGVDELVGFNRRQHARWSYSSRRDRRSSTMGPRSWQRSIDSPRDRAQGSSSRSIPSPRAEGLVQLSLSVGQPLSLQNFNLDQALRAPLRGHIDLPALTLDRLVTRLNRLVNELSLDLELPTGLTGVVSGELSVDGSIMAPFLKGRFDIANFGVDVPQIEPLQEGWRLEGANVVLGAAYDGRQPIHEAGLSWSLCWQGSEASCTADNAILALDGELRAAARPEQWIRLPELPPTRIVDEHIRRFRLQLFTLNLETLPQPIRDLAQQPRGLMRADLNLQEGPSLVFSYMGQQVGIDGLPSADLALQGELDDSLSAQAFARLSDEDILAPNLVDLSASYELSFQNLLNLNFSLSAPFSFRLRAAERALNTLSPLVAQLDAFTGKGGLLVEGGGSPLSPWVRGLAYADSLIELGGQDIGAEIRFGICSADDSSLGVYARGALVEDSTIRRLRATSTGEPDSCPGGLNDSLGEPELLASRKEPVHFAGQVDLPRQALESVLRGHTRPDEIEWSDWPVQGHLSVPSTDVASLIPTELATAWVENLGGRVFANIEVGRVLGNPDVSGDINLDTISGTIRFLGRRIDNLSAELVLDEDELDPSCEGGGLDCQRRSLTIPRLILEDSHGKVELVPLVDGETPMVSIVGLRPEQVSMRVSARDLWAVDEGGTAVSFSGDIDLDGTFSDERFLLTLTLDDTTVRIPQEAPGLILGPSSLPSGVFYFVGEDVTLEQVGRLNPLVSDDDEEQMAFDLSSLGIVVNVRTRGRNRVLHPMARLGYTVNLDLDTVGNDFRTSGTVNIEQGDIRFAGRQFHLEQGVVTFQGVGDDAFNPRLDFRAVYIIGSQAAALLEPPSGEQATIIISVTGLVSDPQIAFRGDPEMSDEEAIFLLATGRPRTQEDNDADAGSQVAAAAGNLLLGLLGDKIIGGLPVDTLRIEGDSETGQAIARVEGGFYLRDNLYFSTTYIPGAREDENDVEFGIEWIVQRLRSGSIRLGLRAGNAQQGSAEAMYNVVVP